MPDFATETRTAGKGSPLPASFAPFAFGGEVSDEMHPPAIPMAMENIRANCARGLPTLRWQKYRPENFLICGGGPSIKTTLPILKEEIAKGGKTIAINDTYDWLVDRGIIPDYFAMCEIEPWPINFIRKPQRQTMFCLPSLAHTSAFERLKDFNILLWHLPMGIGEEGEYTKAALDGQGNRELVISGGEAMSIRAIPMGGVLGFRRFQMFGVDGSFMSCDDPDAPYPEENSTHVYHNRVKDDVPGCTLHPRKFWHGGRIFWSHHCYARQMLDLIRYCRIRQHMFTLKCHGDGMVQHAHRMAHPRQYEDNPPLMDMNAGMVPAA